MHSTQDEDRADSLAAEALTLKTQGKSVEAVEKLREAISLGPNNPQVQSAVQELEQGRNAGELVNLCWRYVSNKDDKAADELLLRLRNPDTLGSLSALECLRLLLDRKATSLTAKQDELIGRLALSTSGTRGIISTKFQSSPTEFFDDLYDRGSESVNCLRAVVLNVASWKSKAVQASMKEDLFQLLLAKIMESGHEHDARALKNIALLLSADAAPLSQLIDEDGFDTILSSLDYRFTDDVKSSATLAISKYLNVAQEEGKTYFTNFIISKVERQRKDDTLLAFSAAAAIFPIAPSMTAALFLTEGFLPGLMPLLDTKLKGPNVATAFLRLLNAAAIDEACRVAIVKHCSEWLSHIVSNGDQDQTALAATVLAKLRTGTVKKDGRDVPAQDDNVDELVNMFKQTLRTTNGSSVAISIEGLAYTSLKPEVKEALSQDKSMLTALFRHMRDSLSNPEIVVGGLSIISNLTQYQPNLTDEQKKMVELKAYANTEKLPSLSPLNDDKHTTARCTSLIDAEAVPLLIECNSKSKSATTKLLTANILLSLSKNPKTRGRIAQQGAVKLLIQMLNTPESSASGSNGTTTSSTQQAHYFPAAHALACILISINPIHVFPTSGYPSVDTSIRPLIYLLSDPETPSSSTTPSPFTTSTGPRTLLPQFESLLALTNLASYPTPTPATLILRLAFPQIEDLLLSSHRYLQRASCELICNLMTVPEGIAMYADTENDPRARSRVHLLLALCDVEDSPTRKAAGGALAMLTEFPTVVAAVLDKQPNGKGIENLLSLCEDEDADEIGFRGIVCLKNLILPPAEEGKGIQGGGQQGEKAKEMLESKNGGEVIKVCLRRARSNQGLLEMGVEVLKSLV